MIKRTTILLDDDSRGAARVLASKLAVSPSEVVRRALAHYRSHLLGSPAAARRRRRAVLERLFILFDGNDAEAEIRRLKREDLHW